MIKTIALTVALSLAAGIALAEDKKDAKSGGEKGRDWTLVDTNKDHYIQAEEMAKWLEANPGPSAVKK
ncbi:MAG: hypothetical protein ACREV9_11945 [Burkholderiales bacterium]